MSRRFLLLQARGPSDPMLEAELASFARRLGVASDEITALNLVEQPITLARIQEFGGLLVGGAGEYSVSHRNLPHFEALLVALRGVVETGHPTFASCFGFQCTVVALGGEIVHDPAQTELGTYELRLTENGRADSLLGILPESFKAQLGHKDRAQRLPDGCLNLAASEHCPLQAFRVEGKPIWATQFHPELTGEENLERHMRYLDAYTGHLTPEEQREALDSYAESPETERLLAHFLTLI